MNNRMMLPIELTKILYESWQGEISTSSQDSEIYGKCLNGPGKVVFRNGNQYDGEFYNGLLHGKGKFTWANGIVYQGQFSDNRITGRGQYRWPDGSHYEGEVRDGLRHGYGKYSIDDAVYEGEWFEGKKYGRGKIIFASGSIFEGSFKNDMKEGSGKMYYYPSGNFFEGEWKYDQKSGMGTMNWTDIRQKYVGNWKNNHQEGWGIHLWLQSKGEGKYLRNRYEGNWKNGVRDGFGVFYYANGSKYEGYWKDNMKEGFAFYTDENGKTSLIQFSKDRMLKGQKPSQLDNQNGKKAANKKEVQPNYYSLCLSVQHFFYPQTPNLQQLFNYLLRNNTQLKGWYKGASSFFDQQSQFSFCLTLEGTWKMIRSLKILGDFSLALFDRGLPRHTPEIETILKMVPQVYYQKINYEDIYYQFIASESGREKEGNNSHSQQSMIPLPPFKDYSVHDRQANILFRQFVHLLVWMAYHLDPTEKPQKSLEKLINKISPFFQTVAKTIKLSGNENLSENKSSISKAEKNLTPFYKNANTEVFKALLPNHRFSTIRKDQVVKIRELLGYGVINNCIGQAEWSLLQKIIEKYFDNEVLNRQKPQIFSTSLIPPKILNVLNYQLIQYQFIEIIYILFIKKLPSTKQTQENKKKYLDTLEDIFQARKCHLTQANALKEFKNQVRYIHSAKSLKKKELQAKRRLMQEKKAESEAASRERERQQYQREHMSHEDVDVKQMQFQQQASQFQI